MIFSRKLLNCLWFYNARSCYWAGDTDTTQPKNAQSPIVNASFGTSKNCALFLLFFLYFFLFLSLSSHCFWLACCSVHLKRAKRSYKNRNTLKSKRTLFTQKKKISYAERQEWAKHFFHVSLTRSAGCSDRTIVQHKLLYCHYSMSCMCLVSNSPTWALFCIMSRMLLEASAYVRVCVCVLWVGELGTSAVGWKEFFTRTPISCNKCRTLAWLCSLLGQSMAWKDVQNVATTSL